MAEDWVKRLGQYHLSERGSCVTRCGMPMLGNNYARIIPPEKREKCPVCHELNKYRLEIDVPEWVILEIANRHDTCSEPEDEPLDVDDLSPEIVKDIMITMFYLDDHDYREHVQLKVTKCT